MMMVATVPRGVKRARAVLGAAPVEWLLEKPPQP